MTIARAGTISLIFVVTMAGGSGGPAIAAPDTPDSGPLAALTNCRILADQSARLTCYDQAVDHLKQAIATKEVVVVDRAEIRAARRGLFGFTLPHLPFLSARTPGSNTAESEEEKRIETTVIAARQLGYGLWRITVEGAGQWETTADEPSFIDPTPGAKILIERGAFGAFFVKVGRGQRVHAKRVG